MKILLIEDDLQTIASIRLCIEIYEPDLTLVFTTKGLEAIRMLKEDVIDGVIIDLGLPDIDGMEVLERLRQFSQIPAIVLSSRHGSLTISRAMQLGANDFITKPFEIKDFLQGLNRLIEIIKNRGNLSNP